MSIIEKSLYVQYGCGMHPAIGWRNFDASPTLRFERTPLLGLLFTKNIERFPKSVEYGDIVRGLPVRAGSCKGLYCSHVLEHLALADFRVALNNTLLILRPRGHFRLVLPDLEFLIRQYVEDHSNSASINFMKATLLGRHHKARGIKETIKHLWGNSYHLWMWDYNAISTELSNAGFVNIRRAAYGDSIDPMFLSAEDTCQWENCLGVECQTP